MDAAEFDFDWDNFLMPYSQAVDELLLKFTALKNQYEQQGQYCPIHALTGRVKSVSSIIEKARTRKVGLDEIAYKIKDIAGIRLITQFEADVQLLGKLIATRTDMRVVITKDYFSQPKASGYRSIHVIVEYDVNTIFGVETVLCEIQLRTLAMDFWASIEHSLNYKYKDNMPEHIKERLVSAADTVSSLDGEMGKIRDEIMDAQKLFITKSQTVNEIVENLNILSKFGKKDAVKKYFKEFSELHTEDDILHLVLLNKELQREIDSEKNSNF